MARRALLVFAGLVAAQVLGWILLYAFWDEGGSTGIREVLWEIGGLLVYASMAGLALFVVWIALAALVFGARRARRAVFG